MNRFSSLEKKYPLPAWRFFGWLIIVLIVSFGFWVNYAELEEVAVLSGEVVPQDQVKVIQHLEGGIIQDIHVKNGDRVEIDTPLMQLDLAINAINEDALQIQLKGLEIRRARLVAESTNSEPEFPAPVPQQVLAILEAEKNAYQSRKAQLQSKVNILKEKELQKKLDVDQLRLKLAAAGSDLEILQRKFSMSKELLDANLTPKIEHLQIETELTRVAGEMQVLKPAIPRAKAAAAEVKARIQEEILNYRREADDSLSDTEREIARLSELLVTAGEQVTRTTIRSPIDGIVKNLRINTIGGIVRPGDAIMEIVPTSDSLVIEAKLNPADRGFVRVGQDVLVKVTAYDFFTYGGLKGRVATIDADSTSDQDGNTYFKIVIETLHNESAGLRDMLITPGMQAMVDVHTGKKPVLQYLLQPVLKLRHESFRER